MQLNFKFVQTNVLCYEESDKCKLIQVICDKVEQLLSLPESVSIEFTSMAPHTYGDTLIDYKNQTKIRLNKDLQINDIMIPLVHELIHLHQMHIGQLMITHAGVYVWEKQTYEVDVTQMMYTDYLRLPWEADVADKQPKLLEEILKSYR
jgi:hypothetical protein